MLGNGSEATLWVNRGLSKGLPQNQPRKHKEMAMRYVEGHLYIVTSKIDQRGEGEEPIRAGTILRVVEDLGWCVRFERIGEQRGDDVCLSGFDLELKPYRGQVLTRAWRFARNHAKTAALTFLCVVASSLFLGLHDRVAHAFRGYPLEYIKYEVLTNHIKPGEKLGLEIRKLAKRDCLWTWAREWDEMLPDGSVRLVARNVSTSQHISELGKPEVYELYFETPKLVPGQYTLKTDGTGVCSYNDVYTTKSRPLAFTVDN